MQPSHTMISVIIAASCASSMAGSCFDTIIANITTDEKGKTYSYIFFILNAYFSDCVFAVQLFNAAAGE